MNRAPRLLSSTLVWATVFALLATIAGLYGTHSAFAATPPMPVIANSTAMVTNTGGDPIRIRSGPGINFPRLAYGYEGQTVSVLDGPADDPTGNHWFEVQAPAGTGWMAGAFLQGNGAPITGTALVTNTEGDPLRIRDTADTAGQVLTLVSPGDEVAVNTGPVTDAAGIAWYNVTSGGVTGWSMAQYLSQAGSASQQQSTPAPNSQATPTPSPTAAPASTSTPAQSGGTSTLDQYRLWMQEARTQYPYNESIAKMWSVMMCESGGNATAAGGGGYYRGLFQYAPGTWAGSWNPYRNNSIWDARSQIFATAKAWNIGMQSAWGCY